MKRILIADDMAPVRQVVALACHRLGHEVHEASDASTAIAAYERIRPDLLILDLGMPGGGGTSVLHSLRFGDPQVLCPVLVISGTMERTPDEVRHALAVDRVLAKPFRITELLAAIAELLALPPRSAPPAPSAP